MNEVKRFPSCAALLADQIDSRRSDRVQTHQAVLEAIDDTNTRVPPLDPLRTTVGDELQAVYASMGDALMASHILRRSLDGHVELRFGLGGGDIEVIDAENGIQDGSAWWRAREAIDAIETLATQPGYAGLRTGIVDGREQANPLALATAYLIDAHLSRLRSGARAALTSLLDGLDNQTAARLAGITPSANSQRINHNDLRVLAAAIRELAALP